MAESSTAQTNMNLDNVIKETRCLKQCLRLQNARLQNLHDDKFKEEDIDDILKRKPELTNELKETINLCEECKIHLEKLEIAYHNFREQKGRHVLTERDSGIGSMVSQDLEGQATESGIHAQDTSAHTYSQTTAHTYPEVVSDTMEDLKDEVDDTEC